MTAPSDAFSLRLATVGAAVESAIAELVADRPLPGESARPPRLLAAMRHATVGGKRIRPFLVIESAALFGIPEREALLVAAAFECVHCYSLMHDDLPAMDNDDLRRGRPTVHKAFDEATAILAGDALLTLAFDALATGALAVAASERIALIALLARAGGVGGMAGGQMLDLAAEGRFTSPRRPVSMSVAEIEKLQSMKTGALLAAACEAGAVLARAGESERRALAAYGRALGLAFQIADDLLDAEGDAAKIGKAAAKDAKIGKATLVSALGIDGARTRLAQLVAEGENALRPFGARASMLVACIRYVAERKH